MKRSDFRWSRSNMIWLLGHLYAMREGIDPFDQDDIPRVGKPRPSPIAPFVPICELAAEVDMRIDRCGRDGILMRWHYCEGKSVKELAIVSHDQVDTVERRINNALSYICGRRGRHVTYWEFLHKRKSL